MTESDSLQVATGNCKGGSLIAAACLSAIPIMLSKMRRVATPAGTVSRVDKKADKWPAKTMRGLEDALQKAFDGEQKAPMEQENNYFDDWAHFAQKEQNMQSHTKHQRQAQVHAVVHTIVARVKMQYDIDQAAKIKAARSVVAAWKQRALDETCVKAGVDKEMKAVIDTLKRNRFRQTADGHWRFTFPVRRRLRLENGCKLAA